MLPIALLILRIGLGISFIYTSYFILKSEDHWADGIKPWAKRLLPVAPERFMASVAVYDLMQGLWLISGWYLWIAAAIATLHLIQVLIGAGINDSTYRDIGLMGAALAVFLLSAPEFVVAFLEFGT